MVAKWKIDFGGLLHNTLLVRKTIKTKLAVITPDSTRSDTAKWQVRRCQMNKCIINRAPAK